MAHESLGVQALARVSFTESEILGLNLLSGGIYDQEIGQRGKGQRRQKPGDGKSWVSGWGRQELWVCGESRWSW